MANVNSFTFSITRISFPDGHICSIDYSYYLKIDPKKYYEDVSFSIGIELCGKDLLHDKSLGTPPYDSHMIDKNTPQPVSRKFVVPCDTLDENWGADHIYLKIYVSTSDGELITEKSATIEDWF